MAEGLVNLSYNPFILQKKSDKIPMRCWYSGISG